MWNINATYWCYRLLYELKLIHSLNRTRNDFQDLMYSMVGLVPDFCKGHSKLVRLEILKRFTLKYIQRIRF